MVQTRGGSNDQGSGQGSGGGGAADLTAAKLDAIMAKLKVIDTLQADLAALKTKDKGKGGSYEEGSSAYRGNLSFRPFNKIEFPSFGGGDPRGWLLKAEKYFRYYQIPEDDKLEIASMHLEGDALDLYSWLAKDQPLLFWEDLVQAFHKSFGPAEFQNPDELLCSIKQTGTVQEYRQEFAKRSARVSNWPDHCLLGVFLNGLRDELKADVRIHKPRTVYNAMSLAMEFEAKSDHTKGGKSGSDHSLQNVMKSASPTNFRQQSLGISEAEKQARYVRGECFRCGKKFGPGHRCKTGTLRILEVEDDQEERDGKTAAHEIVNDSEDAEISLHALAGTPNHSTLIVSGLVNSFEVKVLIDCGSTHNFINEALLPKLGLTAHEVASFGVRIGNGDMLRCNRVCKDVELCLANLKIIQDLYPFSLGGADIVLGIQWLASLNTVKANWKKLFLKFTINGKDYELKGQQSSYDKAAVFRHLTIEPGGQPINRTEGQLTTNRLEDKSGFRVGRIDTVPGSRKSAEQREGNKGLNG